MIAADRKDTAPRPPGDDSGLEKAARILFLCTYNAIRSPLAAALARRRLDSGMAIESAGVRAGKASPFAIAVAAEAGLDLGDHIPRSLDQRDRRPVDLIISLTPEAQHRAVEFTRDNDCRLRYWPTFDPTVAEGNREAVLASYRLLRDQLADHIEALADELEQD